MNITVICGNFYLHCAGGRYWDYSLITVSLEEMLKWARTMGVHGSLQSWGSVGFGRLLPRVN